tara:strand:- start:4657 stop:5445 length:789 start_codon:yes stop_codon:yes gene_type:complete
MLIICNGTFKSGSSWLHAIVVEILRIKSIKVSEIPISYNFNTSSPTRILERNLRDFIIKEDLIRKIYVTKSHYFRSDTLSYKYSDSVVFLFIKRDLKDAIVSHYFHFRNYRIRRISFTIYFWCFGIFKAYEMYLFNKTCRNRFPEENYFTYEDFKNSYSKNIKRLIKILKINNFSNEELQTLKQKTSLKHMKKEALIGNNQYYPELKKESHKLFRSGKIGEWKYFFSTRKLFFIEKIIMGKTPFLIKIGYFCFYTFRRKIGL